MNICRLSNINFKSIFNSGLSIKKPDVVVSSDISQNNQYVGTNDNFSNSIVATSLVNADEINKYNLLLNCLKDCSPTLTSCNQTPLQQMDALLKNGKLLSKASDGSTMLDNLYQIATIPREQDLNQVNLICNILDNTTNPRVITQTLGDIPEEGADP